MDKPNFDVLYLDVNNLDPKPQNSYSEVYNDIIKLKKYLGNKLELPFFISNKTGNFVIAENSSNLRIRKFFDLGLIGYVKE